jgi:hypothetical protein
MVLSGRRDASYRNDNMFVGEWKKERYEEIQGILFVVLQLYILFLEPKRNSRISFC